jgi:hypothetical protein
MQLFWAPSWNTLITGLINIVVGFESSIKNGAHALRCKHIQLFAI